MAGTNPPVEVEPGRSHEMVEGSARYLVTDPGDDIGVREALAQFEEGVFAPELAASNKGEFHDWRVWIALPFESAAPAEAEPMRRVIGIGGIFVKPPRVYLTCGASAPREILATQTREGGPLSARYFTYVRSQSFTIDPQQSCLALINTASSDNPNIGIFREGELGTRQVIAVLLKGGFTATLLIIGLILATISYLTSRPLGVLIGITYSLAMIQNEASLFTTTLIPDPLAAREVWENITLLTAFSMLSVFLYGFRKLLRLENGILRTAISILVMLPLIMIARSSNATPDIIWALYLGLFLFALTAAVHFDIARPLRFAAGGILIASAVGAVLIEPYYLGRDLSDLTIEWFRDAIRLIAGLGMLLLLLVDVLQTRRERARMFAERIDALETQAQTDRRLLETEREYARAREAATRTKAQLAAASHDIRQPIVGLRAAVGSEAERLSPGLQERLGQAIDYLEHLTREYSDREETPDLAKPEEAAEAYPLSLITRAVENMFAGEAKEAGVSLSVEGSDCPTQVPALALIRGTSNLVANALRHANAGTIRVVVGQDGGRCHILVSDDGKGMDAITLAQVQQSGSKSEQSDGDGLGLAIVHELAQRHGLEFTMTSEPGEGTQARLLLPDQCE
ncbi:MAG: ATP-binding protein [Pseudomonadota bacterium]